MKYVICNTYHIERPDTHQTEHLEFSLKVIDLLQNLANSSLSCHVRLWWSEPDSAAQGGGSTTLELSIVDKKVTKFTRTDSSYCNGWSDQTTKDFESVDIDAMIHCIEDAIDLNAIDPHGIYSYDTERALADCINFMITSDSQEIFKFIKSK